MWDEDSSTFVAPVGGLYHFVVSMTTFACDNNVASRADFFKLELDGEALRSVAWNTKEAVSSSFLNAGKAIIITSIILCGGFMTLGLSSFLGTFYIGVLISTTLLLAVVSDLFVLPWLVMKLLRWNAPKRPSILSKILRP